MRSGFASMAKPFRFVTTPDVEPTNNLRSRHTLCRDRTGESRKNTRGKRRRWCERNLDSYRTCSQQGHSVFEYLNRGGGRHLNRGRCPLLVTHEANPRTIKPESFR